MDGRTEIYSTDSPTEPQSRLKFSLEESITATESDTAITVLEK